jgi:tRNA(Ile)-lysidine synthase
MADLLEHVTKSIQTHSLLRHGQPILVAVSGGLDSIVLFHILHELSSAQRWKLTVAHLNHQLRGRSSDMDERLVCRTARKLGWPAVVERADVRQFARASKLSLEMAARRTRHDFLARTAAGLQIGTIALGHHADDQVELFFLRLLRGSGSEGLAGMKWSSPSPANPQIKLIRPLLSQSKEALAEFAKARKIPFREDASNRSLDILRNRIRHELIPLLRRKYQPGLARTILRIMEILRAESEVAGQVAAEWLNHRAPKRMFGDLTVAIQRRCVQAQLQKLGIPTDFDLVEELRTAPERVVSVAPEIRLRSDATGRVHLVKRSVPLAFSPEASRIGLKGRAGKCEFGPLRIYWSIEREQSLPGGRRTQTEFFDADKVGAEAILRHWKPGDQFQPIGMDRAAKLQDLFTNQKIPAEHRRRLVIAAAANGEIFWVEGLRIAERFKLTSGTRRRLRWRWERLK